MLIFSFSKYAFLYLCVQFKYKLNGKISATHWKTIFHYCCWFVFTLLTQQLFSTARLIDWAVDTCTYAEWRLNENWKGMKQKGCETLPKESIKSFIFLILYRKSNVFDQNNVSIISSPGSVFGIYFSIILSPYHSLV